MNQTNNKIVISIITPCYNAAPYIATTIKSVQQQTFTDWEMIVVDDGSTDNSAHIVSEIAEIDSRIKLIQKENGGSASARKLGLSLAQGKYIQFLDADDRLDKHKLQLQITLMEQQSLDVSYTDWCWINMNGETTPTKGLHCNLFRLLTIWGPFGTLPLHCFMYKIDFLRRNNINIPTHIKEREDWDFHIEVFSANPSYKRMKGYCGAMYTKAPTGKTTGATQEQIQIGTFRYLTYKISQKHCYKKLLLQLRFSTELFYWLARSITYGANKPLLSYYNFRNDTNFRKTLIIGTLLLPISSIIAMASSLNMRLRSRFYGIRKR